MRNNTEILGRFRNVARKVAGFGVIAAAAATIFAGTKPASATPAGLTYYPSTDIYGPGNFHFDADTFLNADDTDAGAFGTSIGLEYGFGGDTDKAFDRAEAGFDYLTTPGDLSFGKRFIFNAKTQLFNNSDAGTRVVAGVWGVGDEKAFAPNIVYLLGSKNFDFGRVHLGVSRSLTDEDVVGKDRTNVQVGYDRVFADGKWQFTLDYLTGDTTYSALAPGLIYYINDKAAVQVGYVHPNEESLFGPKQVYLGFDYNFGGSPTEAAPTPPPPAP